MSENDAGQLFVWRGQREITFHSAGYSSELSEELARLYGSASRRCPFCPGTYTEQSHTTWSAGWYWQGGGTVSRCNLCGFAFTHEWDDNMPGAYTAQSISTLCQLDINSAELAMGELGSHLRRNFRDILALTPQRFSGLVGDIYKRLGYEVRYRPQTHDGGFDLVLLEDSAASSVLVQCKRYSGNRKIGVDIVREMLGVYLYESLATPIAGVRIVTTSKFTRDATELAAQINTRLQSTLFKLTDADELLREMELYNEQLPPLELALWSRSDLAPALAQSRPKEHS